jgi:hypothetical protein
LFAQTIERLGVKGPLTFNHTSYELSWTSHPNDVYFIQEYLPKGETSEHYNQMLSIFLLVSDVHPEVALQQKKEELEKRKEKDPTCNYAITVSPDGSECIIDFLVGESKNDKMTIQEFNVHRYRQVDLGNGKKGILVYAYSKRAYGNDITRFLKKLGDFRIEMLHEMIGADVPVVKII